MLGLPSGNLYMWEGAILAGEDNSVYPITDRACHASIPDLVVDPLVIGAGFGVGNEHLRGIIGRFNLRLTSRIARFSGTNYSARMVVIWGTLSKLAPPGRGSPSLSPHGASVHGPS
jgi:hypothetical protein